jgi:bifunctional DNase/RNase
MTNADTTDMVPVTIMGVAVTPGESSDRRERFSIVLASAAEGDPRRLLIGVGDAEAAALAFSLQGQEFPRPMTYQFMAALVAAAGSAVRSVRVTRTDGQVFYAQVTLRGGAIVDARPSDAINLAAVTGAPVLVASDLLDLPVDPELTVPLPVLEVVDAGRVPG